MHRTLSLLSVVALNFAVSTASAHGPDGAKHQMVQLGDVTLESGAVVKNLKISYNSHGSLNVAKDNAILVLHGFGDNHHGFDGMIGPGKALDTDRYFIIASDQFGSTQIGFDHSTSPTNSGMKMNFPLYNYRDMIQAQHKLVTDGLGIRHLRAVLGISMGATQSLQYAVMHPDFMDAIVPIVGVPVFGNEAFFAMTQVQSIIENCAAWQSGNYTENSTECAGTALWNLANYLFSREWWDANIRTPAEFDAFRKDWSAVYFGIQDMRDLYYLAKAFGSSPIATTPGFNGDLNAALQSIKAKTMFIYSPKDMFFLPKQVEQAAAQIKNAQVVAINADAGHSICCGVDPQAYWIMSEVIRGLLEGLNSRTAAK
jgi:homoserine O-acetyltransferase/O-succinyltransferase